MAFATQIEMMLQWTDKSFIHGSLSAFHASCQWRTLHHAVTF